jgi:hypothetical protein
MTTFHLLSLLLTQVQFHREYWWSPEKNQYQQVVRPKERWLACSMHRGWASGMLYPIAKERAHFLEVTLRDYVTKELHDSEEKKKC